MKDYLSIFKKQVFVKKRKPQNDILFLKAQETGGVLEVSVSWSNSRIPDLRIFLNGAESTTYVQKDEGFVDDHIFSLLPYRTGGYRKTSCSHECRKLIKQYCAECKEDFVWVNSYIDRMPLLKMIYLYQNDACIKRKEIKYASEIEAIESQMQAFKELPEPADLDSYAKELFKSEFYLYLNRKEDKAFCTKCGKRMKASKYPQIKNGVMLDCPKCGKKVKCRANPAKSRKVKWSLLVQAEGDHLFFRYYRHMLFSNGMTVPAIESDERIRNRVGSGNDEIFLMKRRFHGMEDRWAEFMVPTHGNHSTIIWPDYQGISVHPESYTALEKSAFKDSGLAEYLKGGIFYDEYGPIRYGYKAFVSPWLAPLAKNGYFSELDALVNPAPIPNMHLYDKFSWIDKNLNEEMVENLIHEGNLTIHKIVACQILAAISSADSVGKRMADVKDALTVPGIELNLEKLSEVITSMKGVTLHKVCRYINKTKEELGTYLDYLNMLSELDYPNFKLYLYPREMEKMHDTVTNEYNDALLKKYEAMKKEKDEKQRAAAEAARLLEEGFRKQASLLVQTSYFRFENDNYTILIPGSPEDLIKEGKMNGNCVGSYIKKFSSGTSVLFFIRKKEDPEKTFFTLELNRDMRLVQCRTFGNKGMEDYDAENETDITGFVKAFLSQIHKERKAAVIAA